MSAVLSQAGAAAPAANTVAHGADAVADDKRGALFSATLTLAHSSIDINGQRVALSPGINLSAEIKTRRRRVADYLLSPIRQAANESLRER